jgi:uncharacterized membrane protein YgdD (TMEM256/DUF423 family)
MAAKPYGVDDAKTEIIALQAAQGGLAVDAGAVAAQVAADSTHTIKITKGGVTYYLLATTVAPA